MRLHLVPDDTCKAIVSRFAPMGHAEFGDNDRGLAVRTEGGHLVLAIVFSDYRPHFGTIELSAVALKSHALSSPVIAQLAGYCWGQLRVNRVWARTSFKNARAKALLKHIGFTREATHADFYGAGLHAETWRMLKREWDALHELKAAA